ncbi:MAG: hypothetical protein HQ557_08575 [Bacteroidetes bacterium]|nr:hypothetical protein [Bacteroidota bacterium]
MKILKRLISSPEEGAKPSIKLATDIDLNSFTGAYFNKEDNNPIQNNYTNPDLINKLWNQTQEVLN